MGWRWAVGSGVLEPTSVLLDHSHVVRGSSLPLSGPPCRWSWVPRNRGQGDPVVPRYSRRGVGLRGGLGRGAGGGERGNRSGLRAVWSPGDGTDKGVGCVGRRSFGTRDKLKTQPDKGRSCAAVFGAPQILLALYTEGSRPPPSGFSSTGVPAPGRPSRAPRRKDGEGRRTPRVVRGRTPTQWDRRRRHKCAEIKGTYPDPHTGSEGEQHSCPQQPFPSDIR